MDYHRPTATKDEHGGWNGPVPVVRNDPDRGMIVCRSGGRDLNVRYPDARHSMYIEAILMADTGLRDEALTTVLQHIASLSAGKVPEMYGYTFVNNAYQATACSRHKPRIHLALTYVVRNYFRIQDVFAMKVGKSIQQLSKLEHADRSALIHYVHDESPRFHFYETRYIAIYVQFITPNDAHALFSV